MPIRTRPYPNGKIRYTAYIEGPRNTLTGKRQHLNGTERKTLREAKLDEAKMLLDKDKGRLPKDASKWPLAKWLDWWHAEVGRIDYKPSSWRNRGDTMKHLKRGPLGGTQLKKLRSPQIQEHLNALGKEVQADGRPRFGAGALKSIRGTLKAALDTAVQQGVIDINPAVAVKVPAVQHKWFPILKPDSDQWARFVVDCEELIARRDASKWLETVAAGAFLIAAFEGLRISEILGLRWEDIDFDNSILHVRHQLQKDHDGRWILADCKYGSMGEVPLVVTVASALHTLKGWQAEERLKMGILWHEPIPGLVFTTHGLTHGQPFDRSNVSIQFRKFQKKRPGYPSLRFHDLRGSCGTLLGDLGHDAEAVGKWLRHKDSLTAQHAYMQLTQSRLVGVGRLMDDYARKVSQ